MSKLTIIQLLNKRANGEELPKYIQWRNFKFKKCDIGEEYYSTDCGRWLFKELDSSVLNEEIEVLEEEKKIPEKLGECAYVDGEISYSWSKSEAILKTRINEIIDCLDYLKSKGE